MSEETRQELHALYVEDAIDAYLFGCQPVRPGNTGTTHVSTMSSREIAEAISDTVTATVDEVTAAMTDRDYTLVRLDDGRLAWCLYSETEQGGM